MGSKLPFQDIELFVSPSQYTFRSASSSAPTLVIERPTGNIRLDKGPARAVKSVSTIYGILRITNLKLYKYVIVITKALPMGRLRGHMIYKIIATEFLPIQEHTLHDSDEDGYLALLKGFLRVSPMYFSYSLDITNSFQRQSQSDTSAPLWKRADDRFYWNRFIQTDLIDFRSGLGDATKCDQLSDVDPFILPIMFGMLRITTITVKSSLCTFALITRRCRHRAGTRYFSRGIDEHGHVSNYNETEQVIILNNPTVATAGFAAGQRMENGKDHGQSGRELQVLSFVQTRGSIPVYWAEINNLLYIPELQIREIHTAVNPARKHFTEQIRIYGENYLVNLVKQK